MEEVVHVTEEVSAVLTGCRGSGSSVPEVLSWHHRLVCTGSETW